MSTTPKTRVVLSLQQRLEVLQKIGDGVSLKQLCKDYGISLTTIYRLKSSSAQIHQRADTWNDQKRKVSRSSATPEIENRLYTWFLERRALDDRISDAILMEKAKQLHEEYGGPSAFACSKGWLWRFKNRHGIRLLTLHGESADADRAGAEGFTEYFVRRLEEEGIELENVYNMDETGLMWKALPQKTLVHRTEGRVFGKKVKKDRVTVGFCANATGTHKLPPLFVHKYQRPRALKYCRNQLPVTYMAQKNAWVDGKTFLQWYQNYFKPAVRQNQLKNCTSGKVLLLVDNFPAHRIPNDIQMMDPHFEIVFLPPNSTSILQPMDQGIIAKFKTCFRHFMMRRILEYPRGVTDFYLHNNVKICVDLVKESWEQVTAANIHNSWRKLLGNRPNELVPQIQQQQQRPDFCDTAAMQETMEILAGRPVSQEEVQDWLAICEENETVAEEPQIEDNEERPQENATPDLDDAEINRTFQNLLLWSETQPHFVKLHVNVLKNYYDQGRK